MRWALWAALALGAAEIPYDGIDQDGDGADLVDVDGDGWASELALGEDCNDRDPRVNPARRDRDGDGVDEDCDGWDGDLDRPRPPLGPVGPLVGGLLGMLLVMAFNARRAVAP